MFKIAVTSDEIYPVHETLLALLKERGLTFRLFGALRSGKEESWVDSAAEAARVVQERTCSEGIFCCWTGTGISIAANKMEGIRAALCTDAETAAGARLWNHANVLCLSNRLLTKDGLGHILDAWFNPVDTTKGETEVLKLTALEKRAEG